MGILRQCVRMSDYQRLDKCQVSQKNNLYFCNARDTNIPSLKKLPTYVNQAHVQLCKCVKYYSFMLFRSHFHMILTCLQLAWQHVQVRIHTHLFSNDQHAPSLSPLLTSASISEILSRIPILTDDFHLYLQQFLTWQKSRERHAGKNDHAHDRYTGCRYRLPL